MKQLLADLRAKGEKAIKINPISSIYENDDSVRLKFKNQWRNNEIEEICCFMWPCHEIESTNDVEESYENLAKLIELSSPKNILLILDAMDKMRGALEMYAKGQVMEDISEIDSTLGSVGNIVKVNRIGKRARQTLKEVYGE